MDQAKWDKQVEFLLEQGAHNDARIAQLTVNIDKLGERVDQLTAHMRVLVDSIVIHEQRLDKIDGGDKA